MVNPIFAGRPKLNWKGGTPGNFWGHGDSVSPGFGDLVMYDPRVNAPAGDPTDSTLNVNLPAIASNNHGQSIEVHCHFDETPMKPGLDDYLEGRSGRVNIFPAGDDVMQDVDEYYVGPYAYYYSPAWYAGSLIKFNYAAKQTFQGPYTLKVTSAPPASGDAYATGRWVCQASPMAMSRKPQGAGFVIDPAFPYNANPGDRVVHTGATAVVVNLPLGKPDEVVEVYCTDAGGMGSITVGRGTRNINGQALDDVVQQYSTLSGITPLGFARYEYVNSPVDWLITNKFVGI